jgi:hypothetical protein
MDGELPLAPFILHALFFALVCEVEEWDTIRLSNV